MLLNDPDLDEAQKSLILKKALSMPANKLKGQGSGAGRATFILGENGKYERVIRKRKRKSGD